MTAEQRNAAADSTKAARERLQSKKEAVEAELRATPATPQTDARTKGFLQAQRVALVARKKAAREVRRSLVRDSWKDLRVFFVGELTWNEHMFHWCSTQRGGRCMSGSRWTRLSFERVSKPV